MHQFNFKELSKVVGGDCIKDCSFNSIVIDSRAVKPENCFLAIKGENFDGHDFIKGLEGKCCGVIVSKEVDTSLPQLIVEDTVEALGKIAAFYKSFNHAKFIGITPDDIENYKLPSHPLKEVDIKRVKDGLKNDPFIKHHDSWQKALKKILKLKVSAEQQALAKWGLNYVIDKYLPEKMKDQKTWLP